jgi:choline dehydrogenase
VKHTIKTIDYVIVGAGSAGCVLAARLSEDANARVLLIEAGGSDRSLMIRAPGLYTRLWRSKHDWALQTEPQHEADGRRMFWPRGKVLGGSSSLNAMIYIRGHRSNYDEWRDQGNPGWGYDQLLPYFRRSENWRGAPSPYHGRGGPLDVADGRSNPPAIEAFIAAAGARCGTARNDDFNGAEQEGVGRYQYNWRSGRRWSGADAFLHPARGRANLQVVTGATAVGVVIERGRARGVRYRIGATEHVAVAEREVILAAGAIGSPHLLLLSGIGPADHLRAHGVPVVHALPGVGGNLQDHLFAVVQHRIVRDGVRRLSKRRVLASLAQYAVSGTGLFSDPPIRAGAFVRSRPGLSRPDLQFHVCPVGMFAPNSDQPRALELGSYLSMLPTLLYPESRGEIRLRSADPMAKPRIEPRYLTAATDVETLVAGVRLAREIAGTQPLARYCGAEVRPGSARTSDEHLRADLRQSVSTLFHPVGTCKMGGDELAVVDASLRVRGIEGLRVADGAIMPTIVGGNTHAPIVMIAEKAADLISGRGPQTPSREDS